MTETTFDNNPKDAQVSGNEEIEPHVKLVVCGRMIGLFRGWDLVDTSIFVFYEYRPVEILKHIPDGDLYIDYETGIISISAIDKSNHNAYTEEYVGDVAELMVVERTGPVKGSVSSTED
jgi:hypothetical protein